ncbi:hypothetical protein [Syntrophomonas wolfei]|jgi:hypothetical protein|uniref:hypothetical protein n=1 Tax=Syntrophomonas wolfei TaxID=863 RepID=UPI0023F56BF2|nr:hypothetical protein [Syntrophomonas wolfei]
MERTIDEMIDFFLFEKGEDVLVNNIGSKAVIIDATDKINIDADKIIHSKIEIKTGDIVEYNGRKYIITSEIDKNQNSFCGRIKQCNYRIAFNFGGNVKWFDALIETKVMDIDTNQYMSLATGTIKVSLQDNADSRDILIGGRFINTGRAWQVNGIDKASLGLIILTCGLVATDSSDDLDSGIANRWQYESTHTYVLSIDNGVSMDVPLNDTAQLIISVIDNGVSMNPLPSLTYMSSDSSVVAVDNTGKMMGINLGTALVTCEMTYENTVKDTIDITVVEVTTHTYTITITGSTTIKLGQSQSYVAHFYDNGTEVSDKSAVWSIRNEDGTTSPAYATITASTGNGATIKANSSSSYVNKYVVLKATLSDDEAVYNEFSVQLKSLF